MSREKEKAEMLHCKYSHFGYLKGVMGRLAECAQEELLKERSNRLEVE